MAKAIGFAFWSYDLFPYLLGAEFTKLKGKHALVPSFGANAWITPLFVMGIAEGRKLRAGLDGLKALRSQTVDQINAKFRAELMDIVHKAGGKLKNE
jgi:hypothetical protein